MSNPPASAARPGEVLETKADSSAAAFQANDVAHRVLVDDLRAHLAKAALGGGERARARHAERGKLLPRDRVDALCDPGSPFLELSPLAAHGLYDGEAPSAGIVTGVGRVAGLYMGFLANRQGLLDDPEHHGAKKPGGILYREGIAKLAAFARACEEDGIPMVWLQDVSGFDIGLEAERAGLLGYGSSLIYANSTARTPMFTVLLRKASGAGYYAMAGMPYDPLVQLSTTIARLSVMEGRTLAIASFRTKLGDDFEILTEDAQERAEIEARMAETEARIESDMSPYKSASQMDTDEIVQMAELRPWLAALAEMAYQAIGHRRIKNPRIWSLHDLAALGEPRG